MKQRPHKELNVWQKAMELAEVSYRLTEEFPREERIGLISQIRRAAVSIPTNIAEGAARQSSKETLQFYFIARGSLSELDTLLELSHRVGMLEQSKRENMVERMLEISAMLQGLIRYTQRLPRRTVGPTQSPNLSISQSPQAARIPR